MYVSLNVFSVDVMNNTILEPCIHVHTLVSISISISVSVCVFVIGTGFNALLLVVATALGGACVQRFIEVVSCRGRATRSACCRVQSVARRATIAKRLLLTRPDTHGGQLQ